MARCLLIDSELPKMMCRAAILHATRIRNLVVSRGEGKCSAELMSCQTLYLNFQLVYYRFLVAQSSCRLKQRKRFRDLSKLEANAQERKFVAFMEGDNGYSVYLPNTHKVVSVPNVISKESDVSSIPDDTQTPDVLDKGHSNWGSGTQMTVIKTIATKRNMENPLQYGRVA